MPNSEHHFAFQPRNYAEVMKTHLLSTLSTSRARLAQESDVSKSRRAHRGYHPDWARHPI